MQTTFREVQCGEQFTVGGRAYLKTQAGKFLSDTDFYIEDAIDFNAAAEDDGELVDFEGGVVVGTTSARPNKKRSECYQLGAVLRCL